MAEADQFYSMIMQQFSEGVISVDEKTALVQQHAQDRELSLMMIQNLQSSLSTIVEMYSQLYKTAHDNLNMVANNFK